MSVISNVRYAGRKLRKSPVFATTVVATLGLCIGANTAVFTIVDTLFFRPPPYPEPERLAVISTIQRKGGIAMPDTSQTGAQWELVRDHATLMDSAVFGSSGGVNLVAENRVEYVGDQRVGADFFRVLGVKPLRGREFTRSEDVPGGPALAILSFELWRRVFHENSGIVGHTIQLRGAPYTVIGVLPQGFRPPSHTLEGDELAIDIWTPLQPTTTGEGSGDNYEVIARLKPGVSFAKANVQLNSIMRALFERMKLPPGVELEEQAIPFQTGQTYEVRRSVSLMWGAVGIVLLIGCVNIAGLLLARSASQSREVATRLALGGGRKAIIGEILAECVLLAIGGGVIGVIIGKYALEGLLWLNPGAFDVWGSVRLDGRIMAIMLAVSLVTSIVFGVFPAFEVASVDLRSSLAEGGRGTAGSRSQWKRQLLVFAEVALGVVLVISAGLLIRTFARLAGAPPGFDPHNVMVASASLQDAHYKTAREGARLFRESIARIEQIPGVESAAVALTPPYARPLNECASQIAGVRIHGFCLVNFTYATPGMFRTLGMDLLRGTLFTEADNADTARVAVVNEAFVRRYLKNGPDPIGASVGIEGKNWRIIGVVGDVQQKSGWGNQFGPVDKFPQVYVPAAQFPDGLFAMANVWFSPVWMVRTRGEVAGLSEAMRRALAGVDAQLPFSTFRSMEQVAGRSVRDQRYRATLFSALAGLAVLLAAVGIYGLIAQSVSQRTREMGIRLALGASPSGVVKVAATPGVVLSVAGVAAGLILSLFATRVLKSLIWGVQTSDPATFVSVALLLIAVAGVASVMPALRLARIDPAQTLREE